MGKKAKQQPAVDRYIKTAKHAREEIKHGNSKPQLSEITGSYLFSTIGKKSKSYIKEANPQANVISLGIGDVTHASGSGNH